MPETKQLWRCGTLGSHATPVKVRKAVRMCSKGDSHSSSSLPKLSLSLKSIGDSFYTNSLKQQHARTGNRGGDYRTRFARGRSGEAQLQCRSMQSIADISQCVVFIPRAAAGACSADPSLQLRSPLTPLEIFSNLLDVPPVSGCLSPGLGIRETFFSLMSV